MVTAAVLAGSAIGPGPGVGRRRIRIAGRRFRPARQGMEDSDQNVGERRGAQATEPAQYANGPRVPLSVLSHRQWPVMMNPLIT